MRNAIGADIRKTKAREKKLFDSYLDGAVPVEVYRERADELAGDRRALELRLSEFSVDSTSAISEVGELLSCASGLTIDFSAARDEDKREVIQTVLCNLEVEDGHIASYQYKDPLGLLEMESSGAFKNCWWAILDLNQ